MNWPTEILVPGPNITLLAFTDGIGDLEHTLRSAAEMLSGEFTHRVLIDDSVDDKYQAWLNETFNEFSIYHLPTRGFCAAMQAGWTVLPRTEFVFHLRSGYIFERPVNLYDMVWTLREKSYLMQLALTESPDDVGLLVRSSHGEWTEHRLGFSLAPSMYRAALTEDGWPDPPNCRQVFSDRALDRSSSTRFAYWGSKLDSPWVSRRAYLDNCLKV